MIAKLRDLLLLILISSFTLSQNISTELIKGLPSNLDPGSRNTIVFRISNEDKEPVTLQIEIQSPDNWKIFNNNTITIHGGTVSVLPVSVKIPMNTNPGFYQLFLNLKNANINYAETIKVDTHVLKLIDIDINLVDAPKISMAGKDVLANFSVYNKSNSPRRIHLKSTSGTINGAKNMTIDIGETKIINVFTSTDRDLKKTTKRLVDLSVSTGPFNKIEKTYVTIVPIRDYKTDKFHRLPTEVSTMYLYRNFGGTKYNGFQGSLFARGSIDSGDNNFLEIKARGPNQFDNSILGLYDEYYINYSSKNLRLFVGDGTYSLTPLTEYSRYGTGINVDFYDENNTFGFFYMKPSFFPDYIEELAGYFNYSLDENNTIGLSYLQKFLKNDKKPINTYSVQYNIHPLNFLELDVEYSFGRSNREMGHGYSIELSSQSDKIYSSIQLIDSDKNYPGYYNNSRYLNGNLQYIMNKKIKLFTNFHEDESNAQRDTLFGTSPFTRNLTGGLSFSYRNHDYLSFNIGIRERKDRMPLQKFYYKENFSRIAFINNFLNIYSNISGEIANTKNIQTNIDGQSYKTSIMFRYKPIQRLSLSSFFQYYNTYRYSENRSQELIYGREASIYLKSKTNIDISFQNAHNIEDYYLDRTLFDFSISKIFKEKHELAFHWADALRQKQVDNSHTYISIKYSFNFGVPLKKVQDLGDLRGRLLNLGVENITNIVLNLGGKIQVSDEYGLFMFSDIPPGEHYLYLDNASLNFGEIPTVKMPMLITVEPDELTDIQIGLTKAGIITGIVKLEYEDEHSEKLTQNNLNTEQNNVIIEIKLDDEIHRTVVNLNDDFKFMGLRPGAWNLKVYHKSLGKNFTIKNSEMVINLEPGETEVTIINVIKKARRILFQPSQIIVN